MQSVETKQDKRTKPDTGAESNTVGVLSDGRIDDDDLLALWTDLLRAASLVGGDLARRLTPAGRTADEVELLMQLAAAPEQRLRMIDVAALLRLGKSSVTRLVDRLEDSGLVLRVACPSDRRVTWVALTDAGHAELAACGPAFVAGLRERLGERLDAAQVAALRGHRGRVLGEIHDETKEVL